LPWKNDPVAFAIDPDLGTALRGLRRSRGLSLDEASRRGGASKAALSAWENGTRCPRGPALVRLLDALEANARIKAQLLLLADPQQARIALAGSHLGAPIAVGTILRAMRKRRGMAQADLARAIGVSQAAVSKWEVGDAAPSPETVHVLGFALGASVEETLALMSVGAGGRSGLSEDPETALAQIWSQRHPYPLREMVFLGYEAELRRRIVHSDRWEVCLVSVIAARANFLFEEERNREIIALAPQAIRIARSTEARVYASVALAALTEADRRLGRGRTPAFDLALDWAKRLPSSFARAWMMRQHGMSLVREGQVASGIEWVARSSEMDIEVNGGHPEPCSHRAEIVGEAYLAAGEAKAAAELLAGRRWQGFRPTTYVRIEHANGRAATDADMAYLRYWTATQASYALGRRRLALIERRQAILSGTRSRKNLERIETNPAVHDPDTEARLWSAVLREHRG
jgi:transcriptional regulator with XRE-family HTH domain